MPFETDENGLKIDPILVLVKRNEPSLVFLEKSAWIQLLAFSQPPSRDRKLNITIGVRACLKLVLENIFPDYKNTKWNTKISAYTANTLQQMDISNILKTYLVPQSSWTSSIILVVSLWFIWIWCCFFSPLMFCYSVKSDSVFLAEVTGGTIE